MDIYQSFGSWLRRRRKSLDLTQNELSNRIGCSVGTIQKIEREERRPSRQIAEIMADVLIIPPDQRGLFLKVARGERSIENLEPLPHLECNFNELHGSKQAQNLPIPVTPFVGREAELGEIQRLFRNPDCRLLTVLGQGGIGKTRLCLEALHRFLSEDQHDMVFPEGIFFISLAQVNAFEHILSTLAEGIGFAFSGQADLRTQLFAFLQDKRMLLVLDNLEHLLRDPHVATVGLISDLLKCLPGIKLIVTSRERLNLAEEWVLVLDGLPYPLPSSTEDVSVYQAANGSQKALAEYSAIDLFLQNVRRRTPNFQITPENQNAVLRICQMVNGMPLAIEMAAIWASTLSCEEIANEIEQDLDFLSTHIHNVPERHRSIRAAFDHSWKLLTEGERKVLAGLSVFRGGFRREAAENIAGSNLVILSGLIDKSLVRHSISGRYDLHDLVRQYAHDHLINDPGAYDTTRDRHSHYYLSFLEKRVSLLRNSKQKETLIEISLEIENLRRAWEWAVLHRQGTDLQKATIGFMVYHELRNLFEQGEALFKPALDTFQKQSQDAKVEILRADLMAQHAWFAFRLGRMGEALKELRESVALLRKYDERILLSEVLWYYAFACWFSGEFQEALISTQEGLELNHKLDRTWQVAIISFARGGILHEIGEYEEAHAQLREAVSLCRRTGDPRIISNSISMLCRTKQVLGRYDGMKELLREGLQLTTSTGDRYGVGMTLEQLGLADQATGDFDSARDQFIRSIQLFKEIGDLWSLSRACSCLGKYYLITGEVEQALSCLREAFKTALEGHAMANAMDALASYAEITASQGEDTAAFRLATFVCQHPNSSETIRARAGQVLVDVKSRMLPEQLLTAVSEQVSIETLYSAGIIFSDFSVG